jgi:hypothetical protein
LRGARAVGAGRRGIILCKRGRGRYDRGDQNKGGYSGHWRISVYDPTSARPAGSGGNAWRGEERMRKLIAFDDDTAAKLKQLARDRMATFQELADEAFADLLKKHGIPIDLKDALKKSARAAGASAKVIPLKKPARKR